MPAGSDEIHVRKAARRSLALIAGPCVIESDAHVRFLAGKIREIAGPDFVFKASFDKANRSSGAAYRGPGIHRGMRILEGLKADGYRVLTDIHEPWQADVAARGCDILQIPAFLCRQTDLLLAAAGTGRIVNIKKGNSCHRGIFGTRRKRWRRQGIRTSF